jgi:hypothetical protein
VLCTSLSSVSFLCTECNRTIRLGAVGISSAIDSGPGFRCVLSSFQNYILPSAFTHLSSFTIDVYSGTSTVGLTGINL